MVEQLLNQFFLDGCSQQSVCVAIYGNATKS